jgi:hypothetical protein
MILVMSCLFSLSSFCKHIYLRCKIKFHLSTLVFPRFFPPFIFKIQDQKYLPSILTKLWLRRCFMYILFKTSLTFSIFYVVVAVIDCTEHHHSTLSIDYLRILISYIDVEIDISSLM